MKETFAPVPNVIMERTDLLAGSKLCFGRLLQYQGTGVIAYPSISTLAKNLGVGKRQIINYLKELEKHKFVTIKKQPGLRNHYVLNSTPEHSSSPVHSGSNTNTFQITTPVHSGSPSTKEKRKRKGKDNNIPDLMITNTLKTLDLPDKIKKLFVDWVDVRVMCHGKLPAQSQDGQLKRLLGIPANLRKESLEAAIAGTWKNIGKIQKKDDDPEPESQSQSNAQDQCEQYMAEQEAKGIN